MHRLALSIFGLLVVFGSFALTRQPNPHIVDTPPLSPVDEKKGFRLPPGYEIQLVAAEPDIQKPLNIAFDDQGRLWVTDTIEYPYPVPAGRKPRDTVKILSDFDANGKARKITTFADGLNIPIGVQPLPGTPSSRAALVFSIPSIYLLQDTSGNGIANKRDVFYGSYEFRDTHGMTNAFHHHYDGWVYACHGFSNRSTVKGADGQSITMQSGNTYRMRTDGSHIEQFTWGQVNPFGLTTDERGYLYTSDCHSQPIYQLIRGGYYPSFGKPHDGLGFAPEMINNYKGSTAVAGITYYGADQFPAEHRGTAFVGDVVTNQIVQFRMTWTGSSPKASQHVFMDSKDRWFRPVDVKLGPDGALYIADFYNRIIGHYEVPLNHPQRDRHRGRIWRIVYTGKESKGTAAPRKDWVRAKVSELIDDLSHPNILVRMFATHQLASRGKQVEKSLSERLTSTKADKASGEQLHVHGLWVLDRLGVLKDDVLIADLQSTSELVRIHSRRILSERSKLTEKQRGFLFTGLEDASPHVQRAAAEALEQQVDASNIKPLLKLRHKVPGGDTHLLHGVRLALRNQLRPAENWKSLGKGGLDEKDARAVADVALGVHSPESAQWVLTHLQSVKYPTPELTRFVHHVARYGSDDTLTQLTVFCRADRPSQFRHQAMLVRAVARGMQEQGKGLTKEAQKWATELTEKMLASARENDVRLGVELTGQLRAEGLQNKVIEMARATKTTPAIRIAILQALANLDIGKHAKTIGDILRQSTQPIEVREQAAALLARANQPGTRNELVTALATAPARLQNTIAGHLAGTREGTTVLLDAVAAGKASARLLQERALVVRLEATGLPGLKERLKKLTAGLPAADVKLAKLLTDRRQSYLKTIPDLKKGQALFEKHCAICHQVGGKGAKVGPQLDGIGLRGLDRLLEDTLDPNRNVDQAFRTTSLTTKKGQVIQGLFLREEGAVLILADNQGKEQRVNRSDVEERSIAPLSPMPANFAEQLPEKDFLDLMSYLLALKPSMP